MKNLKKVLSLVLALAMAMSLMTTAFASKDFGDADKITKTEAVEVMAALGILEGSNGNFDPQGTLTREQAAKIITYIVLGTTDAEKQAAASAFADVKTDRWSASYIAFCASEGYIAGMGNNKFNPTGALTGYQFGKMLLCALGYDAEATGLVGDAWQINTGKYLVAEGLDENMDGVDMSKALTRENAAQLALNAMKWTDEGSVWQYTEGTGDTLKTYEFDTKGDAQIFYALSNDTNKHWVGEVKTTEGSLLKEVYDVTAVASVDVFGRPATVYSNADWDDDMVFAEVPVATFTTAMKEKDIYTTIGASGISGSSAKYIVMDEVWVDGVKVAVSEQVGNGQYQAASAVAGSITDIVVIAKGDKSNAAGFGNGTTVEIFKADDANHYVMVAVNEYISTVKSVIAADKTAETNRKIVVAGSTSTGEFETDAFAKGDVVLYTKANDTIQTVTVPETISGKVTKIANSDTYTIGGNTYVLSQNNKAVSLNIGDNGTWYVDSCGNIIDVKSSDDAEVYYGYLLAYEANPGTDAGLLGNNAKNKGEKFKFVDATGTTVILDGAYDTDKDGKITKFVASNDGSENANLSGLTAAWSSSTEKILFSYELNSKGEITQVYAGTVGAATLNITKGSATINNNGTPNDTSDDYYATKDTVYFYVAGDDVAVYTGYQNAPSKTGAKNKYYMNTDKAIDALVLEVTDVDAESDAQYVYFAGNDVEIERTEDGDVYTYTNVYVDGKKTTLVNDAALTFTVGYIYEYTTDGDGYATLVTGSTIDASKTNTGVEITNVQATYFQANKIIYTDKDTVFYEIDQTNNVLSVVDALPALSDNDAYDVMLLWNDKGTAHDAAADLVVFYTK